METLYSLLTIGLIIVICTCCIVLPVIILRAEKTLENDPEFTFKKKTKL